MEASRGLEHLRSCWTRNHAAYSVCSPPQPNPGLPGFGHFRFAGSGQARSRLGRGWGWGWCSISQLAPPKSKCTTPLPTPPPQGGREQTEFAARLFPVSRMRVESDAVGEKMFAPPYSGWMPACLIILPHLPSWSAAKSSSSLGELENASKPALPRLVFTSGLSMILRSSALSSAMMSEGVPAGANIAAQESM